MVRPPAVESEQQSNSKAHAEMGCQQIHFHMQVVKRSEGRNAVACASYRAAIALYDQRTGLHFDFSKSNKEVVGFSEIMAPKGTPAMLLDRETLWQNVEQAEKRADAQLCREFDAALPIELTKPQQIALMQDFCQSSFVDCGMICDTNMHDKQDNPHFHTMMTMRHIDSDAEYGFGNKNRSWNRKNLVDVWRHNFTNCINKHLEQAGSSVRYSCETLETQGIDRIAQIHVGPTAEAIGERGKSSWRVEQNCKIIDFNQASSKLKAIKAEVAKANTEKEEKVKSKAAHAEALEIEAQRSRSIQNYIELLEQLDRKLDKHSRWIDMKAPASVTPEAEHRWEHVGSVLRESIRKIVQSIRTAIADYLGDYGRDLRVDAWGGGSNRSNEPDEDIEINGP
ncbi:MAG: MobQ family relaxase [Mariprofundaceae bacterium]